ncbi:MAG: metal ABC transporter permease, partial [Gemmatimonadota bacterium]
GTPEAERECRLDHLSEHLRWTPTRAEEVVKSAEKAGFVRVEEEALRLTPTGREAARVAMLR